LKLLKANLETNLAGEGNGPRSLVSTSMSFGGLLSLSLHLALLKLNGGTV
jgi:hypothetical protein